MVPRKSMKTIHRDIASALIFSKDSKLLMGMKDPKSGGVYADCWHIPGGGVDEGETQEQALRREMLEEVGIDIANSKVMLVDDQGSGETEKILQRYRRKSHLQNEVLCLSCGYRQKCG